MCLTLSQAKSLSERDETADSSITNVTGSNSVNVFLGLGLPWTIASLYWYINGPTDEWRARYGASADGGRYNNYWFNDGARGGTLPGVGYEYSYSYSGRGHNYYVVSSAGLAAAIVSYTLCSFVALGLLQYRRVAYGGELGGPALSRKVHAAIFVCLYLFVIVTTSLFSDAEVTMFRMY